MKYFFYSFVLLYASGCNKQCQVKIEPSLVEQDLSLNNTIDIRNCPVTPIIEEDAKIPQIYKTNNLRQRTGYATFAKGVFIRIIGTITDSNCVPIRNATVQIWHADYKGIYKNSQNGYLNDSLMYMQQNDRFEKQYNDDYKSDVNFTGSGTAITDNLGRFTFLSIMPGSPDKAVYFRIVHKDFFDTKTKIFLNSKGTFDPLLVAKKISTIENNDITETIYECNITLDGYNKYLSY